MSGQPHNGLRRVVACLLLVAGSSIMSGNGSCAESDELNDVLHSLSQRRHGEVSFIEQHFLAILNRPVESSGELVYDAPDHLEKRTIEPHPETLTLQGEVLTVQHGRGTRVLNLKSYPEVLPLIESIRATLAGDRAALERRFKLDFGGGPTQWLLVLVPLDPQLVKVVSRVQIEGSRDELQRVEIFQPDGDRSLMTLRPHTHP